MDRIVPGKDRRKPFKISFSSINVILTSGIALLLFLYLFISLSLLSTKPARHKTISENTTSSILAANQRTSDLPGFPYNRRILTAILEPINQTLWDTKPLPVRTFEVKDLKEVPYPKLSSCSKLPEQWPVDDYPDEDPFLPVSAANFK
jgi:hypothetical protein